MTSIFLYKYNALKFNTVNNNIKLCINCKNFIKKVGIPNELGDCKLFTLKVNYITGVHPYVPALISRKLDNLCGINGKYYEDSNTMNLSEDKELFSRTNVNENIIIVDEIINNNDDNNDNNNNNDN
jgi:hypothetical protein